MFKYIRRYISNQIEIGPAHGSGDSPDSADYGGHGMGRLNGAKSGYGRSNNLRTTIEICIIFLSLWL